MIGISPLVNVSSYVFQAWAVTMAYSWKGSGVLAYDQTIIRNRMYFLDIPAVQLGPEFIKMAVRGSEPSISW